MSALTILMNPEDQLPSGPMVQVVLPIELGGQRERPFSEMALPGDDPAMISDQEMKDRAERWFDLPRGTLDQSYKVGRPANGNIMIAKVPVYG